MLTCPDCRQTHTIPREGLRQSWPTQRVLESLADNFRHMSMEGSHLSTSPPYHGHLSCRADPRRSYVSRISQSKRMTIGEQFALIVQLCDEDGHIMAARQGNHDIKIFIDLKPRPFGFKRTEIKPTITAEGKYLIPHQLMRSGLHEFVVLLDNNPIRGSPIEIPVIPRGILGCEIKGPLKGPRDVVSFDGKFLVSDGIAKAVFLVDHVGREIKKLKLPEKMADSFAPMAITTFMSKVFVTDMRNKCIHVYENLDDFPTQFGHSHVRKPTGAAVSSESGDIFIVDNELKQVIVFDQRYRYVKAINYRARKKEDALHNPQMAVINRNGDKLYIADQGEQGNENFVKIINVFDDRLERRINIRMGQSSARPCGIAIDQDDNIFVTVQVANKHDKGLGDNKKVRVTVSGNVFVYNSDGHFLGFFSNGQDHLECPAGLTVLSSQNSPSSIAYIVDSPGKQRNGSLKAFIL